MKICGTDRRCERSIFILLTYGIRGNNALAVVQQGYQSSGIGFNFGRGDIFQLLMVTLAPVRDR